MISVLLQPRLAILAAGLLMVLQTGCAIEGAGYGGDYYGYGADYYEPSGVVYGGWGDGYFVGPYREGFRHDFHGARDVHAGSRSFRAAPAGRSMPSIPSRARGGGAHNTGRR